VAAVAIRDPGSNSTFTCGTPLPAFDNGTRANSWDEYFFEVERTEPNGNGGQGVTDAWGKDGGPIPWPRNNKNQVVIPYCLWITTTVAMSATSSRTVWESGSSKLLPRISCCF
jgi:hypothetical protein